jgi:hypothetical protein
MNKELLIFKQRQMDVKNIKCFLQWWEEHGIMFPIVGFIVHQNLWIVQSKNKTKRI